ncbi:MAG: hypothetical protein U0625_02510 [Phycisphaerales bacterium]
MLLFAVFCAPVVGCDEGPHAPGHDQRPSAGSLESKDRSGVSFERAADDSSTIAGADEWERQIASAQIFWVDAPSGEVGRSREVEAFKNLILLDDAIARFDRIAVAPSMTGRLYALCAFQSLDRHRFDALFAALVRVESTVNVEAAGVRAPYLVRELAVMISRDGWDGLPRLMAPPAVGEKLGTLTLHDGNGLEGFMEFHVLANGACVVRSIQPPGAGQIGMQERRCVMNLSPGEIDELQLLLDRHRFWALRQTRRLGEPDESIASITVKSKSGLEHRASKWHSDTDADFDSIIDGIRSRAIRALREPPDYEGEYEYSWKPGGGS